MREIGLSGIMRSRINSRIKGFQKEGESFGLNVQMSIAFCIHRYHYLTQKYRF